MNTHAQNPSAGLSLDSALTMSSRDISDLTGKRHDNVMRDIRIMLVELHGEGGVLSFEDTLPHPQNGQPYPIFRLPKRETLILVSGYSIAMRAKIIDRWQELEDAIRQQAPALPPSRRPPSKIHQAVSLLHRLLSGGPRLAAQVRQECLDAGHCVVTVREAVVRLAVVSERDGAGALHWRLPELEAKPVGKPKTQQDYDIPARMTVIREYADGRVTRAEANPRAWVLTTDEWGERIEHLGFVIAEKAELEQVEALRKMVRVFAENPPKAEEPCVVSVRLDALGAMLEARGLVLMPREVAESIAPEYDFSNAYPTSKRVN